MGNCTYMKVDCYLGDTFEIQNGIIGAKRDVFFQLIKLMYFKSDELIQNLVGISGECVNWLNHPHFSYCRNIESNLKKQMIKNPSLEEKKDVEINATNLIFKLSESNKIRSLFLNMLIRRMIFECTIRIKYYENDKCPEICMGVSIPSQLKKAMRNAIGDLFCGAGFYFYSTVSRIECNGSCSHFLKEGGIKDGEVITAVINQMNNKKSLSNYGKINLIRFGKKLPHTITNIPLSGVYFGFSNYTTSIIFYIISLHKLRVPSSSVCNSDGVMRCVAYDYDGKFVCYGHNQRDEEGRKLPNVKEYYE